MDKNEIIERLERLARCAVHTVGELPFVMSLDDGIAIHEAIDMLRSQPEPHWIPCSERLPEKPNVYTVTDSNDRVVRFVFTGTDSSREYWKRCAKAWMPLPEPYKGEEHE